MARREKTIKKFPASDANASAAGNANRSVARVLSFLSCVATVPRAPNVMSVIAGSATCNVVA